MGEILNARRLITLLLAIGVSIDLGLNVWLVAGRSGSARDTKLRALDYTSGIIDGADIIGMCREGQLKNQDEAIAELHRRRTKYLAKAVPK